MKVYQILAIVGAVMLSTGVLKIYSESQSISSVPSHVQEAWVTWKMQYGRAYGSNSEDMFRLNIFHSNFNKVNEINSDPKKTYKLELNKFADLSKEEFKKIYLKDIVNTESKNGPELETKEEITELSNVDWVQAGAVTDAKDQGQCGSCWSFSATGALEGLAYINNSNLWRFSEQQLIDCSKDYGNNGCSGGVMALAFMYTANYGVVTEDQNPYKAQDYFRCNSYLERQGMTVNSGYHAVQKTNAALVNALSKQPVSVAIASEEIQLYKNGIYNDYASCGQRLDHGVLAVGYGEDAFSGQKFWKVKNSWGGNWGEDGFFRLDRQMNREVGMCGITLMASYPY